MDEELEENLKMSRQVVRLKIAEERKKQEELRKEIIRIDNDFHENQKRYDNRMKQISKEVEQKSRNEKYFDQLRKGYYAEAQIQAEILKEDMRKREALKRKIIQDKLNKDNEDNNNNNSNQVFQSYPYRKDPLGLETKDTKKPLKQETYKIEHISIIEKAKKDNEEYHRNMRLRSENFYEKHKSQTQGKHEKQAKELVTFQKNYKTAVLNNKRQLRKSKADEFWEKFQQNKDKETEEKMQKYETWVKDKKSSNKKNDQNSKKTNRSEVIKICDKKETQQFEFECENEDKKKKPKIVDPSTANIVSKFFDAIFGEDPFAVFGTFRFVLQIRSIFLGPKIEIIKPKIKTSCRVFRRFYCSFVNKFNHNKVLSS